MQGTPAMTAALTCSLDADGILTVAIDVVERPINVPTPQCIQELTAVIERAAADSSISGLLITSHKSNFMCGADIPDLEKMCDSSVSPETTVGEGRTLSQLFRRIESMGKPVAAAINGAALGVGLELALACHYRVLSDDHATGIGFPEVTFGLLPSAGGTQRLPRLIGITAALPILLQGKTLRPDTALKAGLVHQIAPSLEVFRRAKEWLLHSPDPLQPWDKKGFRMTGGSATSPAVAQAFVVSVAAANKSSQRNYPAPLAILSAVFEGSQLPIEQGLRIESQYFAKLSADPVSRNLIRTSFVRKAFADRLGRRPENVPKSQVKRLGILGAGMMGSGIAYASALAGIKVILLDSTQSQAEKGKCYSDERLSAEIKAGRSTNEGAVETLGRIIPTTDYARLSDCELVIEAVYERRDVKAEVTRKAQTVMAADAVFGSNTSTLPISGLSEAFAQPEQFIGIHFFSPVEKMPLVEIVVGDRTSTETVARALDYVGQLKKTPIVAKDSRGFFTSRVFAAFTAEGIKMLEEGVNPALIENVARQAGMPVGPLAVSDEVTLELQYAVMRQTEKDLGAKFVKPVSYDVLKKFVEELKRCGRREGHGFYEYPADAKKFLWPTLSTIYPLAVTQPGPEQVRKRLLYIQALEAVRCLDEGVLTHPADADLGSVLGWGFPAYTGGALSLIDTVGVATFVAECAAMAKRHGSRFKPPRGLSARAKAGTPVSAAIPPTR
jgi:3-hydroxyacyl-CoA dehydrogenase / enoyl-CoA hydratase / 3-hydroxybutyryl-CoA epimerase